MFQFDFARFVWFGSQFGILTNKVSCNNILEWWGHWTKSDSPSHDQPLDPDSKAFFLGNFVGNLKDEK